METTDYSFLPILLSEELYVIKEKNVTDVLLSPMPIESPPLPKAMATPSVSEKTIEQNTSITEKKAITTDVLVVYSGKDIDGSDFLQKIMAAVHLKMSQIQLVEVSKFEIKNYHPSKALISFGAKLPVENYPLYQPGSWNGITILYADILEDIEKDVAKKKALWASLQKIFLS